MFPDRNRTTYRLFLRIPPPAAVMLLLALLVAGLVCPPPAGAQPARQTSSDNSMLEVGMRGGLTIASYRGGDVGSSANPGFHLGIFGRYDLGLGFALQPEALFVQKGAELDYAGPWKVSHDYVEVPLLLRYRFGEERLLSPYLLGGPYLSFLLSSFSHRSNDLADYSPDDWVRSTSDTEFGAAMGAGVEWNLGWRSFLLEIRYSLGLAPAYDTDLLDYRNGALLLSLGVTI